MRLGIFGGSFDPVHYGHLLLAECCREQCRLDRVRLVPAAISPLKQDAHPATAQQRVEMLRLAIGGHQALEVDTREIDRGGVSYTVDTLRELAGEDPPRELFLLLGSDSLADFPRWREAAEICRLAVPIIVRRAGAGEVTLDALAGLVSPQRLEMIGRHQVQMPLVDLSSTDLRRRVAAGQSIRYRTPRAVEKYIQSQGLYR